MMLPGALHYQGTYREEWRMSYLRRWNCISVPSNI
jgi:hypothetical protein